MDRVLIEATDYQRIQPMILTRKRARSALPIMDPYCAKIASMMLMRVLVHSVKLLFSF